ncbi:MAG: TIGR03617 family F420-dependent LLM class oxidoreductase [Acidimicrobiia bacterium]
MKLDIHLGRLRDIASSAPQEEDTGIAGLWSAETGHDPFVSLSVAAAVTSRVDIGTAIAVAFARTPLTVASVGNDLQELSGGRLVLGLGSQVRAHIQNRYSMPWSRPAARMREFVLAMHAIWSCWLEGEPLRFEGDFYRHTLMTPAFSPGRHDFGRPRVFLSAVGPGMTAVAGEVADGMLVHPFSTERYLREVTMPALQRGAERATRERPSFEIAAPNFVVTGATQEEYDRAAAATRQRIAFYASTPAYRPVLELHGWGDLQEELNRLSKQGEWTKMGTLVTDEMLETFAVCAEPDEVGAKVAQRYGDLCDRVTLGGVAVGGSHRADTIEGLASVAPAPRGDLPPSPRS